MKSSLLLASMAFFIVFFSCKPRTEPILTLQKDDVVVFVGDNLCSRMIDYPQLETELLFNHPDQQLTIRNICDPGNTPGFTPHSGRNSPWAFPGAEKFFGELANPSGSEGTFETNDQWLDRLNANVILAFFGGTSSFDGPDRLELFKQELTAWINHTQETAYDSVPPSIVLFSPIAFQDLSVKMDLPDGVEINRNLALYTSAMKEIAGEKKVPFVDLFHPSLEWYKEEILTIDGLQLNELGHLKLASHISDQLFSRDFAFAESGKEKDIYEGKLYEAVKEKNWAWHNDFKIPNGVHVFGRRYEPFGPDNYPAEVTKIRQMTQNRDTAIWKLLQGTSYDLLAADERTLPLPDVETNYHTDDPEYKPRYLYGEEALETFLVPYGFDIRLFASEEEFPDLANPVQISFDNRGRLWVAVMPSYPHYRAGDPKPNDKLLILEDTDGDGKADKQTVFAEGLSLPIGFEFTHDGVLLSQAPNLVFLEDTDGDDKADKKTILLSGFDDHDTHHAISAFVADPSGAVYMGEGVFLHTNVETPYGPVRGTNGGFFRYDARKHYLERTAQIPIPNPWGIAFDDWGQPFFAETSGPDVLWMLPSTLKPRYGIQSPKSRNLIEEKHRVRPTSGLEFVSSRHFPPEVQGDLLINNTIGFLGTKMHKMKEDGTGFTTTHDKDLIIGKDPNFRPVDMEFAPDGSLYVADWHNVLIGHMQHNARDPLRDHNHGRIYRVTYPSRPLVRPAYIAGAPIDTLLKNLKLPEYRSRYRTRRELRGRDANEVQSALKKWLERIDEKDPDSEHYRLEGLWVQWGLGIVDTELLTDLLSSNDHKVRAAAVMVLRYAMSEVQGSLELLKKAASDSHGRVRLEAIVAASWLKKEDGLQVLEIAGKYELDDWMKASFVASRAHLEGRNFDRKKIEEELQGPSVVSAYQKGKEVYEKEGYCITCHQQDGKGLEQSGFPPLAGSDWVTGDKNTLIRITLQGLMGPIEVNGKTYPGQVPMTPFKGLLSDEEVAEVLNYIRNSFGNQAVPVTPEEVAVIRKEVEGKTGFFTAKELENVKK